MAYFLHESNLKNRLIRDRTKKDSPASIATTGLALACTGSCRAWFISRSAAIERTLTTLRFFWNSPQTRTDATGYHGFYYHFLDMRTGRRAWQCELSTVDSGFLLAGALAAGMYFAADTPNENEIRRLANALYQPPIAVGATWRRNNHAWMKPKSGFLKYRWQGYDEALLLYILALGSPTHPIPKSSYTAWASTYKWEHCCGQHYLYAGPLFTHQLSHVWIDFRHIQDAFMRKKGLDYFRTAAAQRMRSNSTRSTTHSSSWATRASAGTYCRCRSRPRHDQGERHRAPILRLHRTWRALRPRRRNDRAVGCSGVAAIRSRNRVARAGLLHTRD